MLLLVCVVLTYIAGLCTDVQGYCPCHPDDRSNHNRYCKADFVILAEIDTKTLVGAEFVYDITLRKSGGCINNTLKEYFKQRNPPHGNTHGNPHSGSPPHGNTNPGNPPDFIKDNVPNGNKRRKRSKEEPRSNKGVGKAKHVGKSEGKPTKSQQGSKKPMSDSPGEEKFTDVDKSKIYTSVETDKCGVNLLTGSKYILSGSVTESGQMYIDQCSSIVIECKKKNKLTPVQENKFVSQYNINCAHGCKEMTFQYEDEMISSADPKACKAVYSRYMCYDQGSTCVYNNDATEGFDGSCSWDPAEPEYFGECGWNNDLPYK